MRRRRPEPPSRSVALAGGAGGVVSARATAAALAAYGIAVPRELTVTSPEEAVDAARRIGYPVVLKISSERIPHKSEAGGVLLGVADDAAVHAGVATLRDRAERFLLRNSAEFDRRSEEQSRPSGSRGGEEAGPWRSRCRNRSPVEPR